MQNKLEMNNLLNPVYPSKNILYNTDFEIGR
jgi:hypothetical protein